MNGVSVGIQRRPTQPVPGSLTRFLNWTDRIIIIEALIQMSGEGSLQNKRSTFPRGRSSAVWVSIDQFFIDEQCYCQRLREYSGAISAPLLLTLQLTTRVILSSSTFHTFIFLSTVPRWENWQLHRPCKCGKNECVEGREKEVRISKAILNAVTFCLSSLTYHKFPYTLHLTLENTASREIFCMMDVTSLGEISWLRLR